MVAILLADGFEDIEALAPCDILRRGGLEVVLAGVNGTEVLSGRGIRLRADCSLEELDPTRLERLVIPGGSLGVENLLKSEAALAFVRRAHEAGVPLSAICAGPLVLSRLGLIENKQVTCHPTVAKELDPTAKRLEEAVVTDGDLITGRAAGASLDFGFALLNALRGREAALRVAEGMCYAL